MSKCKYETKNGRCGLKGSYAYRHKCFTEDLCKCHEPMTNADRIRAMTDEELANFMAERTVNESTLHRLDKDHGLTAVQIEAIKHNVYCAFMQWLKQPAEG